MKPVIYYFGSLPSGFTSYPGDHTKTFLEEFLERSKNEVQIVVHREEQLLYYGYVRKTGNGLFGICIGLDHIYNDVRYLFKLLDDTYASMIKRGDILKMTPNFTIEWAIKSFASESVALNEYSRQITENLKISEPGKKELPPIDYSISINECLDICLQDGQDKMIDAINRYPNVYIAKTNAEIEKVTGFFHITRELRNEIKTHQNKISELSAQLTKAKAQQRNIVWVSVLGSIALIFGIVIWYKVLFPSEVTHYETGIFTYYGPMKDGKPEGSGVAIYPDDDKDGRKFYVGNFQNGLKEDTEGMLFYKNGGFFFGHISDTILVEGTEFNNSANCCFKGKYNNSEPSDGVWYDMVKAYSLKYGIKVEE